VSADRRRPSSRKPRSPHAARPPHQPGRAQARAARGRASSGRPGGPPGQSPRAGLRARSRIERASAGPLVILSRIPRWLLAILVVIALVAGLAVQGPVGAAFLLALAVFLGWLLALAWPVLPPGSRWARAGAVALVLAAAGWQLLAGL
jgi:hypothetical protein